MRALPLFAATLFVSSALLFVIEPMFARMLLPQLGGAPAVWNTCLAFYQLALLGGYLYAHALTAWLGVRRQAVLHLGLGLLGFALLPLAARGSFTPPAGADPTPWLFAELSIAVGLPFVVLSASAPLLQRWFAHSASSSPYPAVTARL